MIGDGGVLRVLHILNELRPSGAEVMLRTSGRLWRQQGVQSDILATGERVGSFTADLRAAGFTVHHLPFSPAPAHFRAVRRLVIAGNYQVVHVHTERASFYYGLTALSVPGTTVVRTIHNVFAFRGTLRAKRLLQRALLRAGGVRSISVGAGVQANERERFLLPTTHIPNWVDTGCFTPPSDAVRSAARARFGIGSDDVFVVVSVGNCNPVKNHAATFRALSAWDEGFEWCYLHAGEEDPDGSERRLADELGIAGQCRFLGFVPDVAALLHAGDVYVMPSLHEGASIAALEALATGLPCVLASSPGLDDLRQTIDRGIIWVEPSPAGVHRGLSEAAALGGSASRGSRAALHEEVERHHGLSVGPGRYLDVYEQARSR